MNRPVGHTDIIMSHSSIRTESRMKTYWNSDTSGETFIILTLLFIKAFRQRMISCWHFTPIILVVGWEKGRHEENHKHTQDSSRWTLRGSALRELVFLLLKSFEQVQQQGQSPVSEVLHPAGSKSPHFLKHEYHFVFLLVVAMIYCKEPATSKLLAMHEHSWAALHWSSTDVAVERVKYEAHPCARISRWIGIFEVSTGCSVAVPGFFFALSAHTFIAVLILHTVW